MDMATLKFDGGPAGLGNVPPGFASAFAFAASNIAMTHGSTGSGVGSTGAGVAGAGTVAGAPDDVLLPKILAKL
jgi:hypothetical protein